MKKVIVTLFIYTLCKCGELFLKHKFGDIFSELHCCILLQDITMFHNIFSLNPHYYAGMYKIRCHIKVIIKLTAFMW